MSSYHSACSPISLRDGLSRTGVGDYVVANTPDVIFDNLLLISTIVSEGPTALPGDIWTYDVMTGRIGWLCVAQYVFCKREAVYCHRLWGRQTARQIRWALRSVCSKGLKFGD